MRQKEAGYQDKQSAQNKFFPTGPGGTRPAAQYLKNRAEGDILC